MLYLVYGCKPSIVTRVPLAASSDVVSSTMVSSGHASLPIIRYWTIYAHWASSGQSVEDIVQLIVTDDGVALIWLISSTEKLIIKIGYVIPSQSKTFAQSLLR